MKITEDGNLTWDASVCLILFGFGVMFGALKFGPPSIWSAVLVLIGFGVAAVGGMTCRARMFHIKPFDNSYKKARKSYEAEDDKKDDPK